MKILLKLLLIFIVKLVYAFDIDKISSNALIVANDGSEKYNSIQDAINSLPDSASSERVIYIKNGIYNEQIIIQKNYITLIGENRNEVIITNNLNNAKIGSSSECATVKIKADFFKAFDITFQNTAPFPVTNGQAPALYSYGNKHFFKNCNFLGYQNTLLSYRGTHYFKNCYIRGVTDFIWGFGRAVFDGCIIHAVNKNGKTAYITANGNEDNNYKEGGFLIINSKVKVDDGISYYLGRLWKKNTYVIFRKTELPGSQLNEKGWLTFSDYDIYKETSKVGEFDCYGTNYSTTGRASFAHVFLSNEIPSIKKFLGGDLSFVNSIYYQ
ncbi:pectin lyase-like protein [Anaeromyces robustus]|uniref:pectinesterase n=1 Tax=Anaeromyces robustus TaxID=1754192 RepID=A0A1Y1XGY5_9FUNG|nr:pectin lyase-like protein [Anaeromyces robustus]|eukprot:ORX85021.1 pectin lyase-like protein [Anaeromyces robustus]